ncbi:MAG: pilus assembly protein PilM [Pseudomonadota bacterium]
MELCRFEPNQRLADRPELLGRLTEELDLAHSHCISLAENDMFALLLVEAPEVEAGELKSAIRWRIKDLIDFDVDDAVIDAFDIPGQMERGRQKLMYVVAARRAAVQAHISQLEHAGANLAVIDIPELALRNIAGLLPEDSSGVAMLYLNHEGGLLTMTREKSLYLARRLDIGLTQLSAFSKDAQPEEGEDEFVLDENAEASKPLQRAFDNIVLEIQRSLDYYESHFALPQVAGLVLAPLEEPIPGMMSHIANNLDVPVRMLDLNALLECDHILSDTLQAQCLLPIGAALRENNRAL